jgi:23S rRNA (cytosine1962-C5)-methyltransferase
MSAFYPPLRLKAREGRRLRAGHLWVYSNEVDIKATPLTSFAPGDPVVVMDQADHALGVGYVNPHTLICARVVTRDTSVALDRSLIVHRLNVARALRDRLFDTPSYRLVHGEGDGLPGLIVDRYDDVLVVQMNTAGMDRLRDEILAALDKVMKPRAVLLRNDSSAREVEGLPRVREWAVGGAVEEVMLTENGVAYAAPLAAGQKTGWYFDQRMNRARLMAYARDMRVLDVFSYVGAFGLAAARAGAKEVVCVDSSAPALAVARANAERNGVAERVRVIESDAFEALARLRAERERFDIVVLDPPAFIKRRKDHKEGLNAYRRLNQMAMQVLAKDGLLVSASCSFHLARDELRDTILAAGRHVDRFVQIVEQGSQSPDHPVHPAIPETDYLKAYFARVLPN